MGSVRPFLASVDTRHACSAHTYASQILIRIKIKTQNNKTKTRTSSRIYTKKRYWAGAPSQSEFQRRRWPWVFKQVTLGIPQGPPGPGPHPLRSCHVLIPPALSPAFPDVCVGTVTPTFGTQERTGHRSRLTCTVASPKLSKSGWSTEEACEDPERHSRSVL